MRLFWKASGAQSLKFGASLSLSCEGYDDYNDNDGNNDEYNKKHDVVFVELAAGKINKLLFWIKSLFIIKFASQLLKMSIYTHSK